MTAPKRPGRPRRADGLDPNSRAARVKRGTPLISLTLPATTLAILDEIATHLGSSRGGAIVVLVGLGVEAGYARKRGLLESLYEWRSALLRGRRSGNLAPSDEEHLRELEQYIDRIELAERGPQTDAISELRAIATELLAIRATPRK